MAGISLHQANQHFEVVPGCHGAPVQRVPSERVASHLGKTLHVMSTAVWGS